MILLPLRFNVKLILVILEVPKIAILTILAPLNFDFLDIFDIFKREISQKQKVKASKIVEMAVSDQSNLISRKIKVAGKFLNVHTVEFPQSHFH